MRTLKKLLGISCTVWLGAGCGGTDDTAACTPDKIMGPDNKYVTSQIVLPGTANHFKLDFDGSGKPLNALDSLVAAVGVAGFDLQTPLDDAVKKGSAVFLIDVQAQDLMNGCAKATLNLAQAPKDPPKYDGSDTFMVRTDQSAAVLYGTITTGQLDTTRPPKQTPDMVQKIQINLPLAQAALTLTLYGAHIDGAITANGIMKGELHGAIRKKDIDNDIIPSIATLLTDQVHKKPTDSSTKAIVMLFEDMSNPVSKDKCTKNMADCCATNPMTCKILPEEVKSSSLIQSVLMPDAQLFDQDGVTWKPVAKGPNKDSLTVGLGFTAVKANF